MNESHVNAIASLAREGMLPLKLGIDTDVPAVVLGGKIESLEQYMNERTRFRGAFTTSVIDDFAQYVGAHGGGEGFVDPKACVAKVFLNLGNVDKPGRGDWTATLKLEPTAAFAAVLAVNGKRFEQRALVEWIEDWSDLLQASTPGSERVSIAAVLPAFRDITIAQKRESTHTERDMGATRTALEDIEAKSREAIPTHLAFRAAPYVDFDTREFILRVSIFTGDKPQIGLRIVGIEQQQESISAEFKTKLQNAVGDKAKLLLGAFTP
jgi:uncharacterized protein YfdQ (DUF2303 family)